ncbi:transcriptional regulator, partial [Streptomyces noursei]
RSRREGRRVVYFVDDPDTVAVMRTLVVQLAARSEGVSPARLRELGA